VRREPRITLLTEQHVFAVEARDGRVAALRGQSSMGAA
jgi:hypothetical protein